MEGQGELKRFRIGSPIIRSSNQTSGLSNGLLDPPGQADGECLESTGTEDRHHPAEKGEPDFPMSFRYPWMLR